VSMNNGSGFIVKKTDVKTKINYLTSNLAVVESQRHIDAIYSMERFHKRFGEVTEDQERYLDILVDNVKRTKDVGSF